MLPRFSQQVLLLFASCAQFRYSSWVYYWVKISPSVSLFVCCSFNNFRFKQKKSNAPWLVSFLLLPLSIYNSVNHLLEHLYRHPVLSLCLSCLFLNQVLPALRIRFPHFTVHCEDLSIQHNCRTLSVGRSRGFHLVVQGFPNFFFLFFFWSAKPLSIKY